MGLNVGDWQHAFIKILLAPGASKPVEMQVMELKLCVLLIFYIGG
jgi:hypothetical protein